MRIFFDTESVGVTGPLVTIQYSFGAGHEVILHEIFNSPVAETLKLIEMICDCDVVGFNLVHDWFMLTKWYNVLRRVANKSQLPVMNEIKALEEVGPQVDDVCLRPKSACDLMLLARSGKFQYLAKHKEVKVRKVPVKMQFALMDSLSEAIKLPPGVKLNWRASQAKTGRHDVVDVIGAFEGLSTSLKHLYSVISGEPQTGTFLEEVGWVPYKDQPDWMPWGGDWLQATYILAERFASNEKSRDYAVRDVHYTFRVWEALDSPAGGDDDSELACCVGAIHWKGFAVASPDRLASMVDQKVADSDDIPTSPREVFGAITSLLNPTERLIVQDTKKSTLEELARWVGHPVSHLAKRIIAARGGKTRANTLRKLHRAGRFCFSMKVLGARSSRMSGGSEGGEGGMNAQGMPREKEFRALFPLAFSDEHLEGGDFDAFEVSIADAVYGDKQLAIDIRSGKKFHAITGATIYNAPYDQILASKGTGSNTDRYSRAKAGFFAYLYGALGEKFARVLDLSIEEADEGRARLKARYPGITEHRDRLATRFSPLWQEEGIGSKVHWREPDEFIESILGFRRYFSLEWAVVRALYTLQENPPISWNSIRGEVRRTDRVQSYSGACRSALFAAMFSISSAVFRAAANHEIQSPGGQITKRMQCRIWAHQPRGVSRWVVRPLNVHDEVLSPTILPVGTLESTVKEVLDYYRPTVPTISMGWSTMNSWSDK